jgi:carbonic anhydrase
MDILRPACEETASIKDEHERQRELEKRSVLVSLSNLMTFPFVSEAVDEGRLSLHGLWNEIASGALEMYEPESKSFVKV